MFILPLSICFILFVVSYLKRPDFASPNSIFSIVWIAIIVLNAINFNGVNPVTDRTWALVTVSMIAYLIGSFIPVVGINQNLKYEFDNGENWTFNKKTNVVHIFLQLICVGYLIIKSIAVIKLLTSGTSYAYIRYMYNLGEDTELGISALEVMFRMYFVDPFSLACIAELAWMISKTRIQRVELVYILLSFMVIVLHSLSYGGRSNLILLIVLALCSKNIFRRKPCETEKKKKNIFHFLLVVVSIVAVIYITMLRAFEVDLLNTIGSYFGMSLHFVDAKLSGVYSDDCYTYGLAMIMGVIRFPMTMLHSFFSMPYPYLYEYASNISVQLQVTETLSSTVSLNAFATPILYHYIDGGWIGVFIGFFVYSVIMNMSYRNMVVSYYSPLHTIFYMILFTTFYYQIVRWQFYRPQFVFAFVYAWVFVKFQSQNAGYIYKKWSMM